ncbi:hypothetical protein AAFF_G00012800 [Aldrovandia affinis]|uniref:Uncharacterized protein n=1 Tax=Aldrovandia affinis TaxID=143900 RepID=A0AAD7WHA8_9TELE|nr:hypothetical protein AAFF_G00012800 [Aldrovandia affinis]
MVSLCLMGNETVVRGCVSEQSIAAHPLPSECRGAQGQVSLPRAIRQRTERSEAQQAWHLLIGPLMCDRAPALQATIHSRCHAEDVRLTPCLPAAARHLLTYGIEDTGVLCTNLYCAASVLVTSKP